MYSNNVDSIETILGFIDRFTANGKRKEVIDTFSNGCCYWFANILHSRFISGEVWKVCPGELLSACDTPGKMQLHLYF